MNKAQWKAQRRALRSMSRAEVAAYWQREAAAAAAERQHREMLLVAAWRPGDTVSADGNWEWDGAAWQRRQP